MNTKLILIGLVTSIICSTAMASTLTCPIGLLEASAKDSEGQDSQLKIKELSTNLDKDGNSTDSNEIELISSLGEKVKVAISVNSESAVKGIRMVSLAIFVNDARDSIHSLLVRDNGISTGTGWHLGPKGATQLPMMSPNSLSEKSVDLRLNSEVIKTLRAKGYVSPTTPSQIDTDLFSISKIAQDAVNKGDLKEGQALGAFIVFGCWEQKK